MNQRPLPQEYRVIIDYTHRNVRIEYNTFSRMVLQKIYCDTQIIYYIYIILITQPNHRMGNWATDLNRYEN